MAVIDELEGPTYYPAYTNAYNENIVEVEVSGGGDSVSALYTGQGYLTKGDKVLISKGEASGLKFNTINTASASADTYVTQQKIFYNDNTIIGGFYWSATAKTPSRYKYIDNAWVSDTDFTNDQNATYCIPDVAGNGKITLSSYYNSNKKYAWFIDENALTDTGTTGKYLGEYNGKHYAVGESVSDVYEYDIVNRTLGTRLFDGTGSFAGGWLFGNKMINIGAGTTYTHLTINEDGSFTTTATTKIDSTQGLYATGADVGDYIICCTDNWLDTYKKVSPTVTSSLILYQIQSDYTIKKVSVEPLTWLESTDCRLTFDRRTNVLMVGTRTGVFGYQFDTLTKTFTEMSLNLGLGEIYLAGSPYYAIMSPDKTKVCVWQTYTDVSYGENLWIFQRGNPLGDFALVKWTIVDNKTLNYQPQNVYTGIVNKRHEFDANVYSVSTVLAEGDKESS